MRKVNRVKIGSRIQKIRKSYGYTQERLAEEINCSVRYISDIEQNRSNPSYEVLANICNVFKIGINEIFEEYLEVCKNNHINNDIFGFQKLKEEDKKLIEYLIAFLNFQNNTNRDKR